MSTNLKIYRACRLGVGGIIQIWCKGDDSQSVIGKIIFNKNDKPIKATGANTVQYAKLKHNGADIDEVLIGWTEWGAEINCHGGTTCALAVIDTLKNLGGKEIGEDEWFSDSPYTYSTENIFHKPLKEAERLMQFATTPLQIRTLSYSEEFCNHVKDILNNIENNNISSAYEKTEKAIRHYNIKKFILAKHKIAIVGAPNAGKSTLFNCLLMKDRAMVSSTAGTTRDSVRHPAIIGGLDIELIDTAGLMESENNADAESILRARKILDTADLRLLVVDASADICENTINAFKMCKDKKTIIAFNKSDAIEAVETIENKFKPHLQHFNKFITISAQSGDGTDKLNKIVENSLWEDCGATENKIESEEWKTGAFTEEQMLILNNLKIQLNKNHIHKVPPSATSNHNAKRLVLKILE
jgi:tRNA modification GTPase